MTKIKIFRNILCVVCALIFVFSAVQMPPAEAATKDEQIADIKAKQNALDEKIAAAKDKIAALKDDIEKQEEYAEELQAQIDDMQEQIYLLDSEISLLQSDIDELQAQIDEKQAEIDALEAEIKELEIEIERCEQEIEDTKELLKIRLRALYVNGETSELELLLSSGSFANFLTRLELMSNITKHDNELINGIRDAIIKLESDQKRLEENKLRLDEAKDLLVEEQAKLATSQSKIKATKKEAETKRNTIKSNWEAIQTIIANLGSQSAAYQKNVANMAKEKAAFEAKMDAILNESVAKGDGNASKFGFIWPLAGTSRSDISSPYGSRSSGTHRGLDIRAPKGTNIYAAADGKVVIATYHYSYGNYIAIDHGSGVVTLYAHATSLAVSVGDTVKRGQTIAYCGTTGNSTGYHLHFEVQTNGNRVNPLPYLP